MKLHFSISEFNISGEPIPQDIADKILKHHIEPMNPIREEIGMAIWPSENSGYRSYAWEKSKGRSGNSQHTFKSKGAVDWTCSDLDLLEKHLIENTSYTRIARYSTFIHCDYKAEDGKRYYFKSSPSSKWEFIKTL